MIYFGVFTTSTSDIRQGPESWEALARKLLIKVAKQINHHLRRMSVMQNEASAF